MPAEQANLAPLGLLDAAMRSDPYPYYRWLRDAHPVCFCEEQGFYLVTRRSDVERVLRHPADFSSSIMRGADRALLGVDPPMHTEVRRLVMRAFEAPRFVALPGVVEAIAHPLVSRLVVAGGGDFVREVAEEVPLRIIAYLLGLEDGKLSCFKKWSTAVITGASRMIPMGHEAEVARRTAEFDRFFGELIDRRRVAPGDDVVSALVHSGGLDEQQLRSLTKLLLIAGNETTTNLLSNAVLAMLSNASLQAQLRTSPGRCHAWVDETLRFDAPVQLLLRRTTGAIELGGTSLPGGAVVAAALGSAQRDERHHPEPDAFRLDRVERHLGFGAGPHACLGASLALLEATTCLRILLEESRHIEACEPLDETARLPSLQLRGLTRLRLLVE